MEKGAELKESPKKDNGVDLKVGEEQKSPTDSKVSKDDVQLLHKVNRVAFGRKLTVYNPHQITVTSIEDNMQWDNKKRREIIRGAVPMNSGMFDNRTVNIFVLGRSWRVTSVNTGFRAKLNYVDDDFIMEVLASDYTI